MSLTTSATTETVLTKDGYQHVFQPIMQAQIKADPTLRRIPVVILTTSKAEEDVFNSYDHGASSYITKPVSFDGEVLVRDRGIAQRLRNVVS